MTTRNQIKEMKRVIKFVLKTEELGLQMNPKKLDRVWWLTALSDSDLQVTQKTNLVYSFKT